MPNDDIEREKLEIEREKLKIEHAKLDIERSKVRWSTNPLIITVLGFALTGVLGAYFTHKLDSDAKQRAEETASRTRAFEAVKKISDLLYERRVRSVMYASALEHGAREAEVTAAKKAYEDVFAKWNAELESNNFQIREITGNVGHQERSLVEGQFQKYLGPLLGKANACVYGAYVSSLSEGAQKAGMVLTACGPEQVTIDHLHDVISECGYVFVNALYASIQSSTDLQAKAKQIADGMAQACAVRSS